MAKLKINICKNLILSLKSHTLTIIGILGILINEVEKFNFGNWNLGQTFFGLNLKNNGVKSIVAISALKSNCLKLANKSLIKRPSRLFLKF